MALLNSPNNLWEAFGQQILTPIVAQSKTTRYKIGETIKDTNNSIRRGQLLLTIKPQANARAKFQEQFQVDLDNATRPQLTLLPPITFGIQKKFDAERQRRIMDWSYSNMSDLFEMGKKAGSAYITKSLTAAVSVEDLLEP